MTKVAESKERVKLKLVPSIYELVTNIQINVYIGNTLSRLSFQN